MSSITDRTPMLTTGLVRSQRRVPAGRVGAIFDVVITAGFATPWTAELVLRLLGNIHDSLGLGGTGLPQFETPHLVYGLGVRKALAADRAEHIADTAPRDARPLVGVTGA